jgi:hypothetical protein
MDGQWNEKVATFGAEDQNTEDALLAKAIQHEIFHMQGVVTHESMTDIKKRVKIASLIMQKSIAQNKTSGVPQLVNGPEELDPSTLPSVSTPPSGINGDSLAENNDATAISETPTGESST